MRVGAWVLAAVVGVMLTSAAAHAQGKAIVLFELHEAGGGGNVNIVGQCLAGDGRLLWGGGEQYVGVATAKIRERSVVAVPDGAGGAIAAFELEWLEGENKGDVDIAAQRISADGQLLWNEGDRSTLVASSKWRERNPVIVPDGAGGAIIFVEQHAPPGSEYAGDIDVAAQRISADGKLLWGEGRKSVDVASSPALERAVAAVPDGAGGAIAVFEFERRDGENKGDVDIAAQRISADGQLLWNEGRRSTLVGYSKWQERKPVVVPDGKGGVIVFHEQWAPADSRNAGDVDVAAQRLSPEGDLLWANGEQSVDVGATTQIERNPVAIADGQGGAFVAFEIEMRAGEYKGDVDIAAQHVDSDGNLQWRKADDPRPVASSKWLERRPYLVRDRDGGVIIFHEQWAPAGSENEGDVDIAAQRVSSLGQLLWAEGRKSIDVGSSRQIERLATAIPDGEGGAIAVFEFEMRGDDKSSSAVAQRISADGQLLWNEGQRSVFMPRGDWLGRAAIVVPTETAPVVVQGPPADVTATRPRPAAAAPKKGHVDNKSKGED